MTVYRRTKPVFVGMLLLLLTSMSTGVLAQTVKTQGLIKGRSGATLILQTPDAQTVIVLLTDSTQCGQVQGLLKARKKDMSMAALIPGLAVQVEGTYDTQNQLVAKSVKFTGNDLKQARSVEAGLTETRHRAQKNKEELEQQNARLKAQKQALALQQESLKQQQENLNQQRVEVDANKRRIAENQATIAAAVARFGQLDDYYILDEVTVHFANGKATVEPKYKPQLMQLAEKAKTIQGYMIEVKGFASSVGSASFNQKLSDDRARNVASLLLQDGRVPLTNMLAPGAMGESQQVGKDKTAEGESENRRVVVRVLQNKGVAGA